MPNNLIKLILLGVISFPSFAEMDNTMCKSQYNNFSTAPSAIKLKIKDAGSGQVMNVVLRNDDYYIYTKLDKGVLNGKQYIEYMTELDGQVHSVDLRKLKEVLRSRRLGNVNDEKIEAFFTRNIAFERAMLLDELGVKDKKALIETYFNIAFSKKYGLLKLDYYEKYNENPAFIALLIGLGLCVGWGDIAPVLTIKIE